MTLTTLSDVWSPASGCTCGRVIVWGMGRLVSVWNGKISQCVWARLALSHLGCIGSDLPMTRLA